MIVKHHVSNHSIQSTRASLQLAHRDSQRAISAPVLNPRLTPLPHPLDGMAVAEVQMYSWQTHHIGMCHLRSYGLLCRT